MNKGVPALDAPSNHVVWGGTFQPGAEFRPHQLVRIDGDKGCRNCHFQHNSVGAAAMVLPPKSILCMACHAATFSLDDTVSRVSFLIFIVGMAGMCLVWFSGRFGGRPDEGILPAGVPRLYSEETRGRGDKWSISRVLRVLISDVFFQRRLYLLSPGRWVIHGLFFFPILIRFTFGLTALALSLRLPNLSVTTAMLYKNHAAGAFLFDLTGLMILAAALAATYRKAVSQDTGISSLPETGWGLPALLALIVLVGFVLEGMRIAMTRWPEGTGYAFVGYGISLLLKGVGGLADGYGYVWYIHAILVGAFVALIPFTRMSHIVTAPLVLIANAGPAKNE
jgi:predicted CXXCH cytochrome family protein